MALTKYGEAYQVTSSDIKPSEIVENDPEIMDQFKKVVAFDKSKRIAPRANDFLYFSTAMMHAAERSLINDDGSPKLDSKGIPITAKWDIDETTGSWKWNSSDANLKPYKNCFLPGTPVTMEDGSVKNIEDVVVGDMVITHKNRARKVLRTFITPHNGEITIVSARNKPKFKCTNEHPFYHIDLNNSKLNGITAITNSNEKLEYKFSPLNMLNKFDVLLSPVVNNTIDNNYGLHPITNIIKENYVGDVYNLEVEEDNSYVACGIITHNCNGDIFPEAELKKAYKLWVGKPLCKDHVSSTIDGVRGIILDTYYDDKMKQVIALCALDKVNFGSLARAVEAGYANSVSMGTAVGRSICTECGKVARLESDYCDHVRNRKAYGEINVDLAPIELSIVVNGADPLARVRTILAHTKRMEEIVKSSEKAPKIDDILSIKAEFDTLSKKIIKLEEELASKDDNNLTLRAVAQNEQTNRVQEEFKDNLNLIKNKMANVESLIGKITNKFSTEELMASVKEMNKKAYFNGTEEPTPGTPKYSVEDTNHLRDNEDRQMKQVSDMGGTDGLFPGDLEKKKMLARAKVDERRSIRAEAVAKAKTAYMQGTTEPVGNGKPQYTPDPIAEKARKEDKQLQNTTSFGKDGLAPGDKELKEKLCRAKLKARFVKAARPEMNRWDIISGDKVVLSATFHELTGGRPSLFGQIKTSSFAKEMMMNIKNHGLEKAAKLYKSAQAADPLAGLADMNGGAGAAPADPMAGLGGAPDPMAADPMAAMSADPMAGLGAPTGGAEQKLEGVPETVADPVERGKVALEVLEKNVSAFSANVQELINDLKSGQEVVTSQGGALAASGGGDAAAALAAPEQTVTASMKAIQLGASGTKATNELRKIQIVLNAGLNESFKKTIAQLEATKEELDSIAYTLKMPGINSVNQDFVNNLATDATREAGVIIDKAKTLQVAFIKYARGAFGLEKRAAQENRMLKLAADKKKKEKEDEKDGKKSGKAAPVATPAATPAAKPVAAPAAKPVVAPAAKPVPTPAAKPMVGKKASVDDTLEGRNMQRQKLAAKALQMSDMLGQAHPSGSASIGGLDFKSSESVVEDLEDVHNKMEEVANTSAKGDVKRNAALINDLIKAGRVDAGQLDNLAKHGLDKDAVAYWKKYYGQADGGSEYASELVSDYSKEKTAAIDNEQYKVKLASAYDLAYEMAEAGVVPNNKDAIRQEVESIVNWTDEAFQSMKRVVAHRKATGFTKEAAAIEVGLAYDNNVTSGAPCDTSLLAQLNEAFSGLRLGRQ